ncbi:MAG: AAA family ATPase, partial [Anaerolineales bacterium]|nr:AAA family ATPase [Anaerolineales bacterium]
MVEEQSANLAMIQTFLPRSRRIALAAGVSLPEFAQGTCLFADISGFTPLAESLGKTLGPRQGAEALAATINRVFERLISPVHHYGGDVMGFAGDAMTCWFPETEASLLNVMGCALEMQAEMTNFDALATQDGDSHSLSMKIGLAYGPARRMLAGDPDFGLFDLLAGETLDRMAAAEQHARRGEIICAPEIVSLVSGQAEWGDERDGFRLLVSLNTSPEEPRPRPPAPDLPLDVLRPLFPPDILNWLLGAGGQFLAELRPVVSGFVRFEGLDYLGDPQAKDKADHYLALVQRTAVQHGGNLIYVGCGDKGSLLLVLFGAPVAHEDDEVRAVGWALELQAAVRELPFIRAQYTGISRGSTYAGLLGASTRRGYTVIGDEVNAAARLVQACQPGQILVSQRVMKAAQKRFAFHQFPGFQVKGKSVPIPVAMPIAELPITQQIIPVGPLIGRQAEMAQLEAALEALLAGTGGVVRIEGTEGIGKSRLAAELALRAMQRGARALVGHAQSVGQHTPYLPWREVFQGLFGLQPAWPIMQQALQIQNMLGWINPTWIPKAPLLGDLLGLGIPDTPETAVYDAQERQRALFELVGDLLTHLSQQQPLLILLEDCHWADRASLALVEALSACGLDHSRLLLALTHWPADELGEVSMPGLDGLGAVLRLELGELDDESALQMLTTRLGGEPSPDLWRLIQERAQGNPLFLEELAEEIRETNWLQMQAGRWVLAGDERSVLRLPDTIQGVVLARLDRLDEPSKLTLKVASVVGATFEEFIVQQVHPASPEHVALLQQLLALEKRELSRLILPEPRRTYRFWHNIIQEVAYDTLLFSQRRRLHQAVAEWIETNNRAELTSYFPLLAYHYLRAGVNDKAIEYLLKSGDLARRLYAHQEAIQHYERALDLLQEQGEQAYGLRARTLMKLALTYHTAFDFARARQAYEEGFHLWQLAAGAAPRLPRPAAPHALRMDWPYMPLTLDPAYAEDTETYGVVDQLFSGLVDLGPGLEVLPNVAQRWEILDEGCRYVFHLRHDVRWSDGTPLTAQDFVYAWRRLLDPATESTLARMLYDI